MGRQKKELTSLVEKTEKVESAKEEAVVEKTEKVEPAKGRVVTQRLLCESEYDSLKSLYTFLRSCYKESQHAPTRISIKTWSELVEKIIQIS